jgi:hypothetical protein
MHGDSDTCIVCGNELSLSEMKSVLLKKADCTRFVHITCATSDELKKCIIDIATQEKEYYEDLMKISPEFKVESISQFEEKYGTFNELSDYAPSDSEILIAALLHELQKREIIDQNILTSPYMFCCILLTQKLHY